MSAVGVIAAFVDVVFAAFSFDQERFPKFRAHGPHAVASRVRADVLNDRSLRWVSVTHQTQPP